MDWRNLMKQTVTVGAQLWWGGRYGCNNGRYGCTMVMSYIEINKAVSQWLLTFNLCVSVTWPLACAFHISCTHTPEIIDMHRGMCDKIKRCCLTSIGIPMIKITQSRDHFIFIMRIPMPGKIAFILKQGAGCEIPWRYNEDWISLAKSIANAVN